MACSRDQDLGQKTNEKPSVIQEYEVRQPLPIFVVFRRTAKAARFMQSGKATPSPQILAKFERILKVKLRGSGASRIIRSLRARP